ncbi:anillin-like isoform X2 [Hyposmocoma kahamanoa]|uniref:anillin-like isoform X2 n=1 Tax=Hyposmocoma kahamanoa TaxID=1477025 RepID=UPI000E6D75A3|nr:anillin-like isoform X2 [Hyposmocoma kahamanoa]
MDPFTQRMLERARARQEKIDQKLASSGQAVPKRKPLTQNASNLKSESSPVKSPARASKDSVISDSVLSPKKSIKEPVTRSPKRSIQKNDSTSVASPQKGRSDFIVTKKEFKSPRGSKNSRRGSDVSVEINIMHRNDIQIEVQVEERDAPMNVYDATCGSGNGVTIKEIEDAKQSKPALEMDTENRPERAGLRQNVKSRLDRLGNLYSDKPNLSSPIHRTEGEFSSATPPSADTPRPVQERKPCGKKFDRLAALADQINNWEDDLSHHNFHSEPTKKSTKSTARSDKLEDSTLDVSIHSFKDINKVLTSSKTQTSVNSRTFTKPSNFTNQCTRLDKKIVADLEPKPASTTPSATAAPNMATIVASPPAVTKKPSIKKYKAPTPPQRKIDTEDCDSDKDKENNVVQIQQEENANDATDCKQTKPADDKTDKCDKASPVVKRLAPKLNGNVDRNSVLSKAAMFEAGSPKAKDPAEMSLRERKALFEKNKGAAIVPKAPFALAPSVKTLHGDNKDKKPALPIKPSIPTKPVVRDEDSISQTSVGGIKGKLAALFNKEQTISETTIANKVKQEREKEMEMLQNRFAYKPPNPEKPEDAHDSEDEQSESDPSEKAPLMGSTISLAQANRKPEIIANIPKVEAKEVKEKEAQKDNVVGSQPTKRRSSQDSPVVLSVLDDVKRIKVNNNKKESKGVALPEPTSIYPHLSDIETDNSHTQEEYSDCGGSRCGHYTLECVFFFLCI